MGAVRAITEPFDERLPDTDEIESARIAHDLLAPMASKGGAAHLTVNHAGETHEFRLAPAVARTLIEVLRQFKSGRAVTLAPVGATLTSQQAADMLNISRPTLTKLVDEGVLPASRLGRHRRLDANVVFEYKRRCEAERRTALDELFGDSGDLI